MAWSRNRRVLRRCDCLAIQRFCAKKRGRPGAGIGWKESGRDLRYGARTLLRTPGFSLTAILVMALGIGATTSLFTIVRSVLLKPLPFRDPDKLVMLYEHFRQQSDLL